MFFPIVFSIALFFCPDDECRNLPNGISCDQQGFCWVQHPEWEIAAHWHDEEATRQGVINDVLWSSPAPVPSESVECWEFGSPDDYGHVCSYSTDCYDLSAKPLDELVDPNYACNVGSPDGPWDYTVATPNWCFGVIAELDLAIRLRPNY